MKLTVFTPTYNRFSELKELYGSILSNVQGLNPGDSVEWLIVDDGSIDDITPLVQSFKRFDVLEIKLIKKQNGGKHTAFNVAIEKCTGDYFVCIDDDDRLSEGSVKIILELCRKYLDGTKGGVVGRVVSPDGKLLGETIFDDVLVSNTMEIRDKYHFWGEPEVFDVKILKNYHFDEFQGERFLTEAYIFDEMSVKYSFVYTNSVMMVKKFLPGGLTDNQLKVRIDSPRGSESYYFKRKKLSRGFFPKLKAAINRQRFAVYCSQKVKRPIDLYEIMAKPVSIMMIFKDKKSYRSN